MIKFNVEKRFSTDVAFTAEIDCAEDAPLSWKLRLAVLWAIETKANLSWADLSGADLSGANLSWADLSGADLSGANLSKADLRIIRGDVWQILLQNPHEVDGLLLAVREGRIDGSVYSGECCCLVGTIANIRGCSIETLEKDNRRPAERFFMGISEGDKPENNAVSRMVEQWIVEFQNLIAGTKA